jgi:hypothetical protein
VGIDLGVSTAATLLSSVPGEMFTIMDFNSGSGEFANARQAASRIGHYLCGIE